jgi:hypothetical protein
VLVLQKGRIYSYNVCRWDDLRWRDIHMKFHEDWFEHLGNIKALTSTIWEAEVLVLLMGTIYEVRRWDGLRWHDICIPSPMAIGSGIQVILRVLPQQFERLWYWYYWWEGLHKYAVEMASGGMMYTYIPSFVKISTGVQAILRYVPEMWETAVLILLIGGNCDVRRWDGFMWHDIHMKFHEDW